MENVNTQLCPTCSQTFSDTSLTSSHVTSWSSSGLPRQHGSSWSSTAIAVDKLNIAAAGDVLRRACGTKGQTGRRTTWPETWRKSRGYRRKPALCL
ncbi:hypothetical protein Q5P01_009354 [Channa striata]|uniref:Uncharacterized protein n=1 Tax=Channa striata TaxID=64152 RepID=A0AA88N2E2_CHASR|nr:hypothetical protein Q5P01_009354 [Channa striata]